MPVVTRSAAKRQLAEENARGEPVPAVTVAPAAKRQRLQKKTAAAANEETARAEPVSSQEKRAEKNFADALERMEQFMAAYAKDREVTARRLRWLERDNESLRVLTKRIMAKHEYLDDAITYIFATLQPLAQTRVPNPLAPLLPVVGLAPQRAPGAPVNRPPQQRPPIIRHPPPRAPVIRPPVHEVNRLSQAQMPVAQPVSRGGLDSKAAGTSQVPVAQPARRARAKKAAGTSRSQVPVAQPTTKGAGGKKATGRSRSQVPLAQSSTSRALANKATGTSRSQVSGLDPVQATCRASRKSEKGHDTTNLQANFSKRPCVHLIDIKDLLSSVLVPSDIAEPPSPMSQRTLSFCSVRSDIAEPPSPMSQRTLSFCSVRSDIAEWGSSTSLSSSTFEEAPK